ncbi:MAG: helix-turn-helix transcriptional regulator [Anaeromyxobacteraceae bacterium]
MQDEEESLRPSVLAVPAVLLVIVTVLIAGDVVSDLRAGSPVQHVLVEAASMALAVAGALFLWLRLRALRRRASALDARLTRVRTELDRAREDLDRFRTESGEAMRGLAAAIERQFERWGLSSAEAEVALLLLKGLPTKQIAEVRETSERTVRQQALAVYRKAGLSGRAELAAFFLEDLLLPAHPPAAVDSR